MACSAGKLQTRGSEDLPGSRTIKQRSSRLSCSTWDIYLGYPTRKIPPTWDIRLGFSSRMSVWDVLIRPRYQSGISSSFDFLFLYPRISPISRTRYLRCRLAFPIRLLRFHPRHGVFVVPIETPDKKLAQSKHVQKITK